MVYNALSCYSLYAVAYVVCLTPNCAISLCSGLSQVMPQLLHYLKVDDQTRLSTPLPGPATGAAEEGEAVPAAVPEGGRAFFNQKDTVSSATACRLCV
jgi:hypothetical protein